jgi:acyl carrier protein
MISEGRIRGPLRAAASEGGEAATGGATTLVDELRQMLAEVSEGKLTAQEIEPGGHLFDFGYVDSLSAVTFLAMIEERYDVVIEDTDFVERLHTVEAFAQHIEANR